MINSKITFFLTIFLFLAVFFSCKKRKEEPENYDRIAYYYAGTNDNAMENEFGLFRIYMNEDFEEQVVVYPINYTTCIADKGKLLFEYGEGVQTKLWKKCLFSALMEIPLPPSENENWNYQYCSPSCITISEDSYHLGYFARYQHNTNDDHEYRMIYFHWCKRIIIIPDVKSFIINQMSEYSVDGFKPIGDNLVLNRDGSKIFMAVAGTIRNGEDDIAQSYVCLEYSDGQFYALTENETTPMKIIGYDAKNQKVIIKQSDELYKLSRESGKEKLNINSELLHSPKQFARKNSKAVVYYDGWVRIISTETGNIIKDVINSDEIIGMYGNYKKDIGRKLAISPSGDWVIFALEKNDLVNRFGLFTIKADGSELQLLKDDIALNMPMISDYIEVGR